ncbi:MAG: isopentenyl-diphosphate Delta-isomerase [Cyclobacteriaceae bacterium]
MDHVVLVDREDNPVGVMEKMEAHRKGRLHRAFSIFVFNSENELLLQKRALEKYHSGGLWTNTCCSHPRPQESVETAAHRRLQEEMGISCSLTFAFSFIYKAKLNADLIEHELDYVFIGHSDGKPKVNHQEVAAWKYLNWQSLTDDVYSQPRKYTEWFKLALDRVAACPESRLYNSGKDS